MKAKPAMPHMPEATPVSSAGSRCRPSWRIQSSKQMRAQRRAEQSRRPRRGWRSSASTSGSAEDPSLTRPEAPGAGRRVMSRSSPPEPRPSGTPKPILRPRENVRGKIGCAMARLRRYLPVPPLPSLRPRRNGRHELHEAGGRGGARGTFERDGHARPVHLGQDVVRQVRLHVDLLERRTRRSSAPPLRQQALEGDRRRTFDRQRRPTQETKHGVASRGARG